MIKKYLKINGTKDEWKNKLFLNLVVETKNNFLRILPKVPRVLKPSIFGKDLEDNTYNGYSPNPSNKPVLAEKVDSPNKRNPIICVSYL